MKYGIIAAMNEEMIEIKKIMTDIKENKIHELIFFVGSINNNEVCLVQCGIGKVNAARVTQIMIDNFKPECIINVGSAGSANDELEIGDIVIGKYFVQHDFDLTAFGHKKGYIPNIGDKIECNNKFIDEMKETISNLSNNEYNVKIGTIASGDLFCTDINVKNEIRNNYNADAIDMESSAIVQICYLDKVPFVIIRSISDKPNGNNHITFEKFLKLASKRCAVLLNEFMK